MQGEETSCTADEYRFYENAAKWFEFAEQLLHKKWQQRMVTWLMLHMRLAVFRYIIEDYDHFLDQWGALGLALDSSANPVVGVKRDLRRSSSPHHQSSNVFHQREPRSTSAPHAFELSSSSALAGSGGPDGKAPYVRIARSSRRNVHACTAIEKGPFAATNPCIYSSH